MDRGYFKGKGQKLLQKRKQFKGVSMFLKNKGKALEILCSVMMIFLSVHVFFRFFFLIIFFFYDIENVCAACSFSLSLL